MSEQPFTWTSCRHPSDSPLRVLSHEAQLVCDAVPNAAVCWVCGDIFYQGDGYLSLGRSLWHWGCYRCLLCADITRPRAWDSDNYHDHDDENHDVVTRENGLDSGTRASRCEEGRETIEVPLCVYCTIACEHDNSATPPKKALDSIEFRPVWQATNAMMNQTQLGGDSSMDIPPSSPIPHLDEDGGETTGISSILPGETIARIHIRRSRQDPRFAELDGIVPLDSAVQMQISTDLDHPFHTHTHTPQRPPPALVRRPLPWLRQRNQEEKEERPASVLDAHFLPCCNEKTARSSHAGELLVCEPGLTEGDIRLGVNFHVHRLTDLVGREFHIKRITTQDPAGPVIGLEPIDVERMTPAEIRSSPQPAERGLAATDEAPKLLTPTLPGEEDEHSSIDTEIDIAKAHTHNTNTKAELNNDTIAEKKPEGKGKSVAWDSTVAGGESDPASDPGSESSHESYERELADYYIPRNPPRRDGGDPLKRPPASILRETPAQSKEYLELYEPDKRDETRLASLAMPGRQRGRRVGRKVCSKCGH
ncbi:hypothetical protein F5B21DRAFT_527214 [Xylaria acuta]|nr:hypothetical protein F5B21DRAFT_527214 [Xylaria acuta]